MQISSSKKRTRSRKTTTQHVKTHLLFSSFSLFFLHLELSQFSRLSLRCHVWRFQRFLVSWKKKHEFILKNNDSFLKSRNISFVMRENIVEKINRNQNSNKSRRESTIKNEIFRKNNFKHLEQWNLIKNLINHVNIFKWNELLNNH